MWAERRHAVSEAGIVGICENLSMSFSLQIVKDILSF